MQFLDFASVIVFWAAIVLAVTSLFTPTAAFLTRTHDRLHGLASWLSVAVVAGGLNYAFASGNTIF